jgi:hypothetical protein
MVVRLIRLGVERPAGAHDQTFISLPFTDNFFIFFLWGALSPERAGL